MLTYLAGNKRKELPKYVENCRRISFNNLFKRTRENLREFEKLYHIEWNDVYKYDINRCYSTGHGYIIYGQLNNHRITYFRRESDSNMAGQTLIYINKGKRIQTCLLKKEPRHHLNTCYELNKNLIDWTQIIDRSKYQPINNQLKNILLSILNVVIYLAEKSKLDKKLHENLYQLLFSVFSCINIHPKTLLFKYQHQYIYMFKTTFIFRNDKNDFRKENNEDIKKWLTLFESIELKLYELKLKYI